VRWTDNSFRGVLPCVYVCVYIYIIMSDLETSRMRWPGPDLGSCAAEKYTAYLSSPACFFT